LEPEADIELPFKTISFPSDGSATVVSSDLTLFSTEETAALISSLTSATEAVSEVAVEDAGKELVENIAVLEALDVIVEVEPAQPAANKSTIAVQRIA